MTAAGQKGQILLRAHALGFDLAGVAPAELAPRYRRRFEGWVAAGMHGGMDYLARRVREGTSIEALLPGVKSVLILGVNYHLPDTGNLAGTDEQESSRTAGFAGGQVSRYAVTRDYHGVIRKKLRPLAAFIEENCGGRTRVFVDSAPVLECAYAETAGLGFIGKNTMLISHEFGSWLFLGGILSTVELPPDKSKPHGHCGNCRRCLEACPTGALAPDGRLDARKCISYLTIENKGPIPEELRPALGNWIFGCDICQEVCPHNQRAEPARREEFRQVRFPGRTFPLADILGIESNEMFLECFAGTPLKRAGRAGLLRNACVAAGNSKCPELIAVLQTLVERETDELLLEHARWALARLQE